MEYEKIIREQLDQGIVEKAPEQPTGNRVFHVPHKPLESKKHKPEKEEVLYAEEKDPFE